MTETMRLAVLSDIHANLEALQAVLEDLRFQTPDTVISLGDAVGYGPDPEAVVHLLQREGIPSLQGNHEQGLLFPYKRSWFNRTTLRSLQITLKLLSAQTKNILRTWPLSIRKEEYLAVHGCPPDDAFTYLFEFDEEGLPALFERFNQPLCFVGHTHMLQIASWDGRRIRLEDLGAGRFPLDPSCRHIVNVGSVGQPRDGTSAAKYVLWDSRRACLDVRAVAYDTSSTIAKIEALGFPEINSRRLR